MPLIYLNVDRMAKQLPTHTDLCVQLIACSVSVSKQYYISVDYEGPNEKFPGIEMDVLHAYDI